MINNTSKIDISKYADNSNSDHGSKCYGGYPGLEHTALKISRFIPLCIKYVEPFAGLGRVAKFIRANKIILNDMSDFSINYLKKHFPSAEITKSDYQVCIKKNDDIDTFFLIDPPHRTSAYALNEKTFCDRTDTEYFKELRDMLPLLQGKFILCSDASRTGARTFKNTRFFKTVVESDGNVIFGKPSKILCISNNPFIEQRRETMTLKTWNDIDVVA